MKQNNKTIIAGLLGVAAVPLLNGCGWFDGGPAPYRQAPRAGVDRTMPASNALPPPPANQPHEGGFAPADETRGGALGSAVTGKGGQKAQKEAAEKQLEEQSKKARERGEREAEMRKSAPPAEKSSDGKPAPDAAPASAPADKPATPPQATPSQD
jgi:hypothetical protein